MFAGRVQLRASLLKTVLPPISFIVVAAFALLLFSVIFIPLFSLFGWFSSFGLISGL